MKLKPKVIRDPVTKQAIAEQPVIRDPVTKQPLPAEGAEVPETSFWIRRLRAGEVELVTDPEAAAPTSRTTEPTGREPIAPLTTRG